MTPPVLEITSPARAAKIHQGGIEVVVSGFAEDAESPLVSLAVDGQELLAEPALGSQPFAVPTESRWGLSIVTATAEDACGNRTERVQSYLLSNAWFAAEPLDEIERALAIRVGQELLDDGDRSDVDDLASFAEATLADVDLNALVPQIVASDPLRSGCTFRESWTDYGYTVGRNGDIQAEAHVGSIASRPSGVRTRLEFDSLQLPLLATVSARTCLFGLQQGFGPATIRGALTVSDLSATGTAVLSIVAGAPQAEVSGISVDLGNLELSLHCEAIQILCDAGDAIANEVLSYLRSYLEDALVEIVATRPQTVLNAFLAELPPWQTIDAAAPLGVAIDVDASYQDVATSTDGVDLRLDARLQPSATDPNPPPDWRRAIRRLGVSPPPITSADALLFDVSDDIVNQLFWAVWFGGGFDRPDLRAEASRAGHAVGRLSLRPELPPVLRSGDAPDRVEIGFGDAFVELTLDLAPVLDPGAGVLDVELWFSALLDGEMALSAPDRLRFDGFDVRAESEIVSSSDRALAEALRPLLHELLAKIAQGLVNQALGGLRLPTLDLAAAFPKAGVPAGTVIGLASNAGVRREADAYTRVTGDVAPYAVPEPTPITTGLAAAAALALARAVRRSAAWLWFPRTLFSSAARRAIGGTMPRARWGRR